MDNELRSSRRHDRLEIDSPRDQLQIGEDLREEELTLSITDQRSEVRKSRRPFGAEALRRASLEREKTRVARPTDHRVPRCKRNGMACSTSSLGQR